MATLICKACNHHYLGAVTETDEDAFTTDPCPSCADDAIKDEERAADAVAVLDNLVGPLSKLLRCWKDVEAFTAEHGPAHTLRMLADAIDEAQS